MALVARIVNKAGFLGAFISAMGCAACFPALASLGATIGLGILTHWEHLFITTLIPLFALSAIAANTFGWRGHRQNTRLLLGLMGPVLVLAAALLMRFAHIRTAPLLYFGLTSMLGVSVWDSISPPTQRCPTAKRQPAVSG